MWASAVLSPPQRDSPPAPKRHLQVLACLSALPHDSLQPAPCRGMQDLLVAFSTHFDCKRLCQKFVSTLLKHQTTTRTMELVTRVFLLSCKPIPVILQANSCCPANLNAELILRNLALPSPPAPPCISPSNGHAYHRQVRGAARQTSSWNTMNMQRNEQ